MSLQIMAKNISNATEHLYTDYYSVYSVGCWLRPIMSVEYFGADPSYSGSCTLKMAQLSKDTTEHQLPAFNNREYP